MNRWFAAAGLLSLVTAMVHVILGGDEVAGPLLASDALAAVVRYTAYYCWHIVSILLFGMALGFCLAGRHPEGRLLAQFLSGGALLFALLCLGLGWTSGLGPLVMGQWLLFLPIALLGFAGLRRRGPAA